MADTKNSKILFTHDGNGKTQEYTFLSEIGQGSVGKVYRVQDAQGNQFALKIPISSGSSELFTRNAKYLLANPVPYSIPIDCIGQIPTSGTPGTQAPATIMPYGGDNLAESMKVLAELSTHINSNVMEAFCYKTVLTTLYAIEYMYGRTLAHGDLHPHNILSGVDFKTFKQKFLGAKDSESSKNLRLGLYNEMLHNKVQLCDRIAPTGSVQLINLSSMLVSSATIGNHLQYIDTTLIQHDRTLPERDMWPAIALAKELLAPYLAVEGSSKEAIMRMPVAYFGNKVFGTFEVDKSTGYYNYPTPALIRAKLEKMILETDYFYLQPQEMDKVKFPLVLRPVDVFERCYGDKTYTSAKDFEELLKTGNFSRVQVISRGKNRQLEEEKSRIDEIFLGTIERSVRAIDQDISSRIEGKRGPEAMITKISDELVALQNDLTRIATNILDNTKQYEDLRASAAQPNLPRHETQQFISRMQEVGASLDELEKSKTDCDTRMIRKKADLEGQEGLLKQFGVDGLEDALKFVRNQCLGDLLESQGKKDVLEIIKKRV